MDIFWHFFLDKWPHHWPHILYSRDFWPLVTSIDLETNFLKRFAQELHFWVQFVYYLKRLKFYLYSEFVTSNDLFRPLDYFYWKVDVKGVILIYNLPYFMKVKNLTYFSDFWPRVTSSDLAKSFLKFSRQERHFDIQFTHFQRISKFDPKWAEICNLTPNPIFY